MHQSTVHLDGLPGAVVDVDVTDGDAWLVACVKQRGDVTVATSAGNVVALGDVWCPIVRWMRGGHILLVDARTELGRDNAFVFTREGEPIARSCIGDGVQDVLIVGERVVVTYFDEGACGSVQPSAEGLCVFGSGLELEYGYQSGVKDPVEILDCYCACVAGQHEVCFSPSPGFELVRLNVETREQTVLALPARLARATALATDGVDYFFYAPNRAGTRIYRWSRGHGDVTRVGTHSDLLRAGRRGNFISPGPAGYTIVDVKGARRGD